MKFWLDMGIDGFRADAVPYLYEREGTNCENLPETHVYLKELRRFMDQNYPNGLLLCEANQWPEDLRPYFGDGDEFHMGFHFPIMPRIFMSLRREDPLSIVWILNRTPPIPENCQWCVFLRNHDELTLEMVTEEERQWMWEQYAPEPRMRLNLGIRRRLAPLLDNDRRKIELANSLLFTLPGSPVIYYGDEIGMGDNIWLPDRNGVRTPMQWDSTPSAGFSEADPQDFYSPVVDRDPFGPDRVNVADQQSDPTSLFNTMRRMIAVRKAHSAFGWGSFTWVACDSPSVAAYERLYQDERLLIVNNLASARQAVNVTVSGVQSAQPVELISGEKVPEIRSEKLSLTLEPYEYVWLNI
jgi:maltose alpha-D-glucosyltransferase/alpha-amylase